MPGGAAVRRRAAAHVVVDDVHAPTLDDDTAHHLARVVRLRDGDTVTVTDGRGAWRAMRWSGGTVDVDVADPDVHHESPRDVPVTVGWAIPKRERPEWIVQKLTEIGVDRIVVLHAERSVVRWDDDRAARHLAKLRRVAVEALRQSRGVHLPELVGPVAATELLPTSAVAEPGGGTVGEHTTVLIGPEGGWTPDELALAAATVDLGPTVLRVETAALVAATRLVTDR